MILGNMVRRLVTVIVDSDVTVKSWVLSVAMVVIITVGQVAHGPSTGAGLAAFPEMSVANNKPRTKSAALAMLWITMVFACSWRLSRLNARKDRLVLITSLQPLEIYLQMVFAWGYSAAVPRSGS